jgi:ankyrin repeat protein
MHFPTAEMQAGPGPTGVHPSAAGDSSDELTEAETEEVLSAFRHAGAHNTGSQGALRQLGGSGVKSFLKELQRDPNVATVFAKNDFQYQSLIEREYWLRVKRSSLQDPALAGRDDFIILHVHYAGDWNRSDDQATFDRKRSTITQINARHTCDGSSPKFHKPCQDPGGELHGKWREERGTPVLGSSQAPDGWKWRDPAQRNLTDATPCLHDLLHKGERCTKVVRKKYVDLVAAHSQDAPQSSLETNAGAAALSSGAGSASLHQSPSAHVVALASSSNWAALPAPVPPVPPYCILFAGANNANEIQLDLENEVRQIHDAFIQRHGSNSWGDKVIFKHSFYSTTADLSRDLRIHDPACLQFSCHGDASALALFRQDLAAQDLVNFIASWCASGKRLQLIIVNACDSAEIVHALSEHVDFVIGHSTPVVDADAVNFARELYGNLGAGESLELSFNAAKMVSNPYCLRGRKNARMFRLLPPGVSETVSVAAGSSILTPDTVTVDSDCNKLVRFLKDRGLSAIAARFSEVMGIELVHHFGKLQAEDLDDSDLSFLKRWQKQVLMELVQNITAGSASLRDSGLDDSFLSGADTASEASKTASELVDDEEFFYEAALAKHPGDPEDFREHMKGFIQGFLDHLWLVPGELDEKTETFTVCPGLPDGIWSYCMLVWMRFAKDAYFDCIWREKWGECITSPSQDKLLAMLDLCLHQESTSHKRWTRAEFKRLGCNKPFAAAIFVTDMLVQKSLKGHAESGLAWQQDVVKSWFTNGEDASTFVLRANKFLREHVVNGTSVVTQVVETQSYVAFMRMTNLASLLLFEYLDTRKLQDTAASGAKGGSSSLFRGFRMFVSSSRRVFSLTPADVPAPGARPTVLQGLRCLARLSAPAWELLGPMKAAREYVEEEAQAVEENADICLKPKDLDSHEDESGANDAPLLTAPKAKEAALEASTEVSDQTDIFQACAGGHLEIVKRLVEQARVLLVAEDKVGQLPFHHACKGGHLELVKWLAEQEGVLLIAEARGRELPIHIACENGHLEVVKWLAEQEEVSLTAENKEGLQPIHIACENQHLEVVKWLAAQDDGVSLTAENKKFGTQPIHSACWFGHLELVKWLLEQQGVSPTAEDNKGVTAWHLAAKRDHADVISWLVEAKTDVNLKDSRGRTALHHASRNAHERALRALVHAGADIRAQNKRRETPLHFVSGCPSRPGTVVPAGVKICAEILLKARADPDAANCDGERPLHFAVKYGHPEVAKVLLEYGAATNLRSRNRQTPLELCEQVAVEKAQSGDSHRFQELLNVLKQAAKDRPADFSKALLQKHEQSPQGAYASMLEKVVGPNLSAWVGAKSNDARSVTSSSSKASAASTWSAASSGPFVQDCKFWLNGNCLKGQDCNFKHDPQKKGTGLGRKQGDGPGTGARFGPPVVSASTPPMPAASPKSSGSAPRAQVATATKNPFGILEVQEDDE